MDPSNGVSNANGVEKIAVYDQYFASSRVVNGATVKYCKQSAPGPRKVMTSIARSGSVRLSRVTDDNTPCIIESCL